ncbi:MAG: hypothetical protein IKK37_00010, partial [Clostridia bacterium]|nr:hypothetical protein [Clostridia bacterium]
GQSRGADIRDLKKSLMSAAGFSFKEKPAAVSTIKNRWSAPRVPSFQCFVLQKPFFRSII